jgi:hypothetical protein
MRGLDEDNNHMCSLDEDNNHICGLDQDNNHMCFWNTVRSAIF